MAAIGIGLILLVASDTTGGGFGTSSNKAGQALYLGIWGLVLAAAILGSGRRLGDIARSLGLWVLATTGTIATPELHEWPTLVAFGVVQLAIPYVLFARGLRYVQAPEAALITLLEPVLNPIWVFLRHGERPGDATLVGGLFLLAGVAVRYLPPKSAEGQRPA